MEDQQHVLGKVGASLDFHWLDKGVLSKVIDQGEITSCWAIVAASAMGSAYLIGLKKDKAEKKEKEDQNVELELSGQEIFDCLALKFPGLNVTDSGIKGYMANFKKAFMYGRIYGVFEAVIYPYLGVVQGCGSDALQAEKYFVGDTVKVEENPDKIIEAIRICPLPCGITVSLEKLPLLRDLKDGIFQGESKADIQKLRARQKAEKIKLLAGGHALLIVGYGSEEGVDFYLAKNSWGPTWGVGGYGKIARSCCLEHFMYPTNITKRNK